MKLARRVGKQDQLHLQCARNICQRLAELSSAKMLSSYLVQFFLQLVELLPKFEPGKKARKVQNNSVHYKLQCQNFHFCDSWTENRSIFLRYNACSEIYRHSCRLRFQFFVVVFLRNLFVSHSFLHKCSAKSACFFSSLDSTAVC